jgi:hypothetical protein
MQMSVNQLALLTGKKRETISKKLRLTPFEDGEKNAKLFDTQVVLPILYGVSPNEEEQGERLPTAAEASRDLNIAKKEKVKLDMEVLRRERIPIEDMNAINDEVFGNACAILKSHTGKPLDEQLVNDILAQFRDIGPKLKQLTEV